MYVMQATETIAEATCLVEARMAGIRIGGAGGRKNFTAVETFRRPARCSMRPGITRRHGSFVLYQLTCPP